MKSITEFIGLSLSAIRVYSGSIRLWHFDRQVLAVAPFLPRADVNADARKPKKAERHVRVRRTVPTLAIGNDLTVGGDARVGVHLGQRGGGLEVSGLREVARPFDVDGSGHGAAALRPDSRAEVLAIGAGVENNGLAASECGSEFLPGGDLV